MLDKVAKVLDLHYFHTTPENYESIKSSDLLPEIDPRFICQNIDNKHLEFANNSSFVKGCVQINLTQGTDPFNKNT